MLSALRDCCRNVVLLYCFQPKQEDNSIPILNVSLYDWEDDSGSDGEDSNVQIAVSESKQLIPSQKCSTSHQSSYVDIDSQFLTEEIDEVGLKMMCLDRIKMIQDDMNDPSLTPSERLVNQTNLNVLNNIVSNVKLSEKIKLGALHNSQYTDAIILQKQLVCNLAGQKECGEVVKPITITPMPNTGNLSFQDNYIKTPPQNNESLLQVEKDKIESTNTTKTETDLKTKKERKSILKSSKNNTTEAVAAI